MYSFHFDLDKTKVYKGNCSLFSQRGFLKLPNAVLSSK